MLKTIDNLLSVGDKTTLEAQTWKRMANQCWVVVGNGSERIFVEDANKRLVKAETRTEALVKFFHSRACDDFLVTWWHKEVCARLDLSSHDYTQFPTFCKEFPKYIEYAGPETFMIWDQCVEATSGRSFINNFISSVPIEEIAEAINACLFYCGIQFEQLSDFRFIGEEEETEFAERNRVEKLTLQIANMYISADDKDALEAQVWETMSGKLWVIIGIRNSQDSHALVRADDRVEAFIKLFRSGIYDDVLIWWWFHPYFMEGQEERNAFAQDGYPTFSEKFKESITYRGPSIHLSWHDDASAMDAFLESVPPAELAGAMDEILKVLDMRFVSLAELKFIE